MLLGGRKKTVFVATQVTNRKPPGRYRQHSDPLRTDWQRHVLASSGYLELGMFDDAAMVLEEIAPEDKTRNEVLGARVNLYMATKKWDRLQRLPATW